MTMPTAPGEGPATYRPPPTTPSAPGEDPAGYRPPLTMPRAPGEEPTTYRPPTSMSGPPGGDRSAPPLTMPRAPGDGPEYHPPSAMQPAPGETGVPDAHYDAPRARRQWPGIPAACGDGVHPAVAHAVNLDAPGTRRGAGICAASFDEPRSRRWVRIVRRGDDASCANGWCRPDVHPANTLVVDNDAASARRRAGLRATHNGIARLRRRVHAAYAHVVHIDAAGAGEKGQHTCHPLRRRKAQEEEVTRPSGGMTMPRAPMDHMGSAPRAHTPFPSRTPAEDVGFIPPVIPRTAFVDGPAGLGWSW